jgi:hypothetical protein
MIEGTPSVAWSAVPLVSFGSDSGKLDWAAPIEAARRSDAARRTRGIRVGVMALGLR